MANEILKDEQLTDEQLDEVAGGTVLEIQKDANLMHDLGLVSAHTFPADMTPYYGDIDDVKNLNAVQRSWAKFGIAVVNNKDGFNEYYDSSGREIGRQKAIQTAISKSHARLNYYDYL